MWSIDSHPEQRYRCRKQGYIVPQSHPYIVTNPTNYSFLCTQCVGSFEWCRMILGSVITGCHSFMCFVTKHQYLNELGYWWMRDQISNTNQAFLMRSHARHDHKKYPTMRNAELLEEHKLKIGNEYMSLEGLLLSTSIEPVLSHDQLHKLLIPTAAICDSRIWNLTRHRRLPGISRWEVYM